MDGELVCMWEIPPWTSRLLWLLEPKLLVRLHTSAYIVHAYQDLLYVCLHLSLMRAYKHKWIAYKVAKHIRLTPLHYLHPAGVATGVFTREQLEAVAPGNPNLAVVDSFEDTAATLSAMGLSSVQVPMK